MSQPFEPAVRLGHTLAADPHAAVREFHSAVSQPDIAFVLFFCSSDRDLDALERELAAAFGDTLLVGCTTAGEIGPAGLREHSLCGASFAARDFAAVAGLLPGLADLGPGAVRSFARTLLLRFPSAQAGARFGFLMVDGLSRREEQLTSALYAALDGMPLFGGSAGDGQRFANTHVYHDGRFHADSAVLLLVSTDLPLEVFKTQHFAVTEEVLVVTAADSEQRMVRELNGLPAAQEYARAAGLRADELDPEHFASNPLVVLVEGIEYVRSIKEANSDGSLALYCAIDEGVVLRVARGVDMLGDLERALAGLRARIGQPQALIACDCILRGIEASAKGLGAGVEQLLRDSNAIGFRTYGEQYGGSHVNQTLTGVAIGRRPAAVESA
jgi:hypothetical protein